MDVLFPPKLTFVLSRPGSIATLYALKYASYADGGGCGCMPMSLNRRIVENIGSWTPERLTYCLQTMQTLQDFQDLVDRGQAG